MLLFLISTNHRIRDNDADNRSVPMDLTEECAGTSITDLVITVDVP
jgi:hypothetical protein